MSLNLFLRPTNNAKVSYEYKTDVLSTYNNSEDRIAQRDIPRITFQYSYGITDYKSAYELENKLQNTGNASSIFVPDWFCGIEVEDIQQGTNTIAINQFSNLAKNQYVMLLCDNGVTHVSQISDRYDTSEICTITFNSSTAVAHAYMYPLFECEVENDTTANRINPLTNTFELEVMVKTPVFSPLLPHNVQFLGHDVFCDDLQIISGDNQFKSYQDVQENDYEVGVRDRFTFFSRMYNQFSATILAEQDKLEYTRNFIKRRWGKTFACFIPSGVADLAKHEYSTDELTDTIYVKKSSFDFESRPFIAVSHGDKITYAHVTNVTIGDVYQALTIDSETVTTVVLDAHNNVTSVITGGDLGFTTAEIDSIQSLLFARLDDDTVDFVYAGSSADNKGLYSIELSFVETDFYDSSLINYESVDGTVVDRDTMFLFKCLDDTQLPTNDVKDGKYMMIPSCRDTTSHPWTHDTGKYDGTFCFSGVSIISSDPLIGDTYTRPKPVDGDYLIGKYDDFCLQIEAKTIEQFCVTSFSYAYFSFIIKKDATHSSLRVILNPAFLSRYANGDERAETIEIRKYNGELEDFHEFAIQRTNGITYVYCDGYLNGSTTSLKERALLQGMQLPYTNWVGYLLLGADNTGSGYPYYPYSNAVIQQIRLTKNRKVYTGSQMGVMNRVYQLNDYVLPEIKQMDNATIIKNEYRGAGCATDLYVPMRYDSNQHAVQTSGNVNCLHPYAQYLPVPCVSDADTYSVGGTGETSSSGWWNDYLDLSSLTDGIYYPPAHQLKMPFRWHKDLWFDFEIEKVGAIDNGFVLCRLDGIMPKIYVNQNGDKWTFGAFGIDPTQETTVWKDCGNGEKTNVALAIDCQHDRVCVFLDGELAYSRSLTAVMRTLEYATLSIYPLTFQQCNTHLHKMRLVDLCLCYDDDYDVNELWDIGYRTTFFDIEYGTKHGDAYPSLNIVDIDNAYELADLYDVMTNEERVKRYSIRWSDGSRKAKLLNPRGNTLYTVTVIDNTTGDRSYGWYFVPNGFTGEICRSNFSYTIEYDNNGNETKINNVDGVRYNFLTQQYEPYSPTHFSDIKIDKDVKGFFNKGITYGMMDMLGSEGAISYTTSYSNRKWLTYHRYFIDNYIRQIEFVVYGFPIAPTNTLGDPVMYVRTQMPMLSKGNTCYDGNTYGTTLQYNNGWGVTDMSISMSFSTGKNVQVSPLVMSNTYRYKMTYTQGISYKQIVTTYSNNRDDQNTLWTAPPSGTAGNHYTDYTNSYYETTAELEPIHLVFEFVCTQIPNYYNTKHVKWDEFLKNFWVNGKKYHATDLIKTLKFPNYNGDKQVVIPSDYNEFNMDNLYNWIVNSFLARATSGSVSTLDNGLAFMDNRHAFVGGYFTWDYLSNTNVGLANIRLYDYIKYESDFDCSPMVKNLR